MELWLNQLKAYLAEHGLKYSEQRWKIAQLILAADRHLSSHEIVAIVKRKHPAIGAATVYRNIKLLIEAKILKETLVNEQGRSVLEPFDEEHHDHIVCMDCQHVFEFHSEKIETLQNDLTQGMRFKPQWHRHVIYGRCQFKN
ncbi:MAG: Fur family transcriptional regulator [Bacteriovoracia bacterium]